MNESPSSEQTLRSGRTDPPEVLSSRLSTSGPRYLEGALDNPALDEELVLHLLRNRRAGVTLLQRLHRDPRFRRSQLVRRGLVSHPNTPRGLAMNLLAYLFWRDLAWVADRMAVAAPVRRHAIRLLEERLDDMELGEQITLARTGGRSVVLALRRTRREEVAVTLLGNPRLTEDDLLALCSDRHVPTEILSRVAQSRRWSRRYRIRCALVHNRRTPLGVVLGLLTGLLRADLEGVASRPDRPGAIRMAARRVLDEREAARQPAANGDEKPAQPEAEAAREAEVSDG